MTQERRQRTLPKQEVKKYIKIFLAGWIASITILGLFAFGFWYNDSKTSKAEVEYWNKQRDQVGKETTVRQINEYNYNK